MRGWCKIASSDWVRFWAVHFLFADWMLAASMLDYCSSVNKEEAKCLKETAQC